MTYEDLTDEQKQRARSCESAEELVGFARNEGIDLTRRADRERDRWRRVVREHR